MSAFLVILALVVYGVLWTIGSAAGEAREEGRAFQFWWTLAITLTVLAAGVGVAGFALVKVLS